ncbi:hypothetical protein UO65_0590 [Actinokineospora spheciospongiae]|uniref:YbaB/EbfC DNA-binding family protein n=1 Tax=Actinokineospora spheciospongiae TaxID=909613 RepID=W7IUP6_9PSEU|nr:hypothetical protein [Actinokineospora spheciospongiae]EWC64063.1 hypothetical protein UO65_0590 [Actinokineospora spheciospongiae]
MNDLSTDDLLALAEDLDARTRDLPARLAAVTGRATGRHGIEVTVTMSGMLTALDLGEACRHLTAPELTRELESLIHQATDTALAAGVDIVSPIAGPELTTELQRLTAPPHREPSTADDPQENVVDSRAAEPEEDFSAQTFALRD